MFTALFATLAGGAIVVGAIVVMVAKAISPLGRGDLSLQDELTGPPEAAPAFAELQRLELQYALAEELGGLDAGSLETLRQGVVAARTRYEDVLARATVEELTPQQQLDAEAAVADCLSPAPALQPAHALGVAAAVMPTRQRRSDKR
jgi:hypothetical protein